MGELKVTKLSKKKDRANYIYHLINDIKALDIMIERGMLESTPVRIGAEQEFCLIDDNFSPKGVALEVLETIDDPHFTTEIGNYNLEVNLDPVLLHNRCFSQLHEQLDTFLKHAKQKAALHDAKVILSGILPSITLDHIGLEKMTPLDRYKVLNEAIRHTRKSDFCIHIKGTDELNLLHDSVMLESCNTSFQVHLQVEPSNFVDTYNWAQAIAGPVLSVCTNSPLLFGKELWSETRIALFTQSIDTRANSYVINENQSRVSFGSDWQKGSVTDIFRDNIARFRSFISTDYIKDSVDMIEKGEIPKLRALQLHNGTVYPWNRICYGVLNDKPHLRIENRYLPAGPTTVDEIANMAFWVGVMMGKPKKYNNIQYTWDFKDTKNNFFNAARYGSAAQFYWNGKYVTCYDLINDELLPMAYRGLYKMGVSPTDAEYYLKIIKQRTNSYGAAEWSIRSYRNLLKRHKTNKATRILTSKLFEKQSKGYPVSSWQLVRHFDGVQEYDDNKYVKDIMNTDVFSVDQEDNVELVLNLMQWKNIHHLPVISYDNDLLGVLSWSDVKEFVNNKNKSKLLVSQLMKSSPVTIDEYCKVEKARRIMEDYDIHFLPITKNNKLIGLITSNDL